MGNSKIRVRGSNSMSLDASLWAWKAPVKSATQRLVLLSLADRAGENHTCFPSAQRLVKDTLLDRKTVLGAITQMIADGLIKDTGKRVGNGVRVLQLIGVNGREVTDTEIGTGTKNGTSTKKGMPTSTKNGTSTGTKIGIQNLPMNLSMNLSCEHEWIPNLEQLVSVLKQKGHERNLKHIIELPSFEFELGHFNEHNSGRLIGDGKKLYSFATWITDKFERHVKANPEYLNQVPTQPERQTTVTPPPMIRKSYKGVNNG